MRKWIVGAAAAGFLGALALAPAQAAEPKSDGARTATSQQAQAGWDVSDQRRWRRHGYGYGRRFYGGGYYRPYYRPYYGYGYRRPYYGYGYRPYYRPYGFYRPAPFFPFF